MSMTINGTSGLTFNDGSTQPTAANGNLGFRNRIINGAMMIDQRNAGASVTPTSSGNYYLDRWAAGLSQASKFSIQQSSTAPAGFTKSILITSLSAYTVGSGESFTVRQPIEGFNCADLAWGTANASPVTLSFQVRSSLTGTFGGAINNSGNSRSYPFSYTINSANTWETKTVTIAGDTSGTWLTDNSLGMMVVFGLGVGSTLSGTAGSWAGANYLSATGATSVVGTNGATFYITGVQLEKGSTATNYDVRSYGTELQLCQRYYNQFGDRTTADTAVCVFANWSSTEAFGTYPFPVRMRATPTLAFSNISNFTYLTSGVTRSPTVFSQANSPSVGEIYISGFSNGTITGGNAGWLRCTSNSGWISFSSEL